MAGPVAAVEAADYVTWRWNAPGPRGMGVIENADGTSNTRLKGEVIGLEPDMSYRIVGSTERCRNAHDAADRVFFIRVDTGNIRDEFVNTTLDDPVELSAIRSVRLFKGSTQVDCGRALPWSTSGDGDDRPTEEVAFYVSAGQNGIYGMIMIDLGSGDDTINVALHGLANSAEYRIVGSDVKCPDPPSAGMRMFARGFISNARGSYYIYDNDGDFASKTSESVHVFRVGMGRVACSNVTLLLPAVQA